MREQTTINRFLNGFKWLALIVLGLFLLFPEFIANENPIICSENNELKYPAFRDWANNIFNTRFDTKHINSVNSQCRPILSAPILYSADYLPLDIPSFQPPGYNGHLLGTDKLGRDVAAGLIYGTRTAFLVGLISVFISLIFGIFLGVLAGYFGDHMLRYTLVDLIIFIALVPLAYFYGFGLIDLENNDLAPWSQVIKGSILALLILGTGLFLSSKISHVLRPKLKSYYLPLDLIISRLIEIFNSIPGLFILLALLAIFRRPSIWNVIFIIGLIRWPGIARLLRAELLRIKEDEYIIAARATGLSNMRIVLKHALPNAVNPILVAVAFGVSVAIMLESTLSFLGIGLAPDEISWGILLSQARDNLSAWWLAIFPGLAIFLTVLYFNRLGDRIARIGS